MPVMIRLTRQGSKKRANYLIVATDKENKRDGAYLQKLGQYFPHENDPQKKVKVDMDAVQAWKAKGAQTSQTVGQLLNSLAESK